MDIRTALGDYGISFLGARVPMCWSSCTYLVIFKKFHAFFLCAISSHRANIDKAISKLDECTSVKYRSDSVRVSTHKDTCQNTNSSVSTSTSSWADQGQPNNEDRNYQTSLSSPLPCGL